MQYIYTTVQKFGVGKMSLKTFMLTMAAIM